MAADTLTFEQIIYIEFDGRTIGRIYEGKPGYYGLKWEDNTFQTAPVFCSVEDAKAHALKTFKDHL